jgi:hypothetical protein
LSEGKPEKNMGQKLEGGGEDDLAVEKFEADERK